MRVLLFLALLLPLAVRAQGSTEPAPSRAEDPWFGRDKFLHTTLSLSISGGATVVHSYLRPGAHWAERGGMGAATSLVLGLGKEIADELWEGGSGFSWKDLTWDLVGALLGAALVLAVEATFEALRGGASGVGPDLPPP